MKQTVKANLNSLFKQDKEDYTAEVTIISHKSDTEVVAEYQGVRYWAIYNRNTGEYFVNDLDGKVKPGQKVLLVCPDRSAHVKEIWDINDLRKLLHAPYEVISSLRLHSPFCMAMKEEYINIGLPVNEVGSWISFSDENCLNVEGDVVLLKRKIVPGPAGEIVIGMTEEDVRCLVEHFDLDLVLEDEQE